jgi:hypothetical protein
MGYLGVPVTNRVEGGKLLLLEVMRLIKGGVKSGDCTDSG